MRLFIYADPHWSSYSSILRSRGEKYSTRLEYRIKTMNWIECEAVLQNCDTIVCLGDFFDKSELNSEEVTALQEIGWSDIPHWFIVGNHEMGRSTSEHSSSHLFELLPNACVVDELGVYTDGDTSVVSLPYILENNRKPLKDYLKDCKLRDNIIILSHNDISGMQLGKYVSTTGFSIEEIENSCNLFINGHIHNEGEIGNKIINLGNITGQNFSENAFLYGHNAVVLDTAERSLNRLPNPYAINFYKVDLTSMQPTIDDKQINQIIDSLKSPAVATIKTNSACEFLVKDLLSSANNILECRLLVEHNSENTEQILENDAPTLDHLAKFTDYVFEHIGSDALVVNELERISK